MAVSPPGVAFTPPPASILAQATQIVEAASKQLPAHARGGAVGILTNAGWQAAVVQKVGDHVAVTLWIGKADAWNSGLTGGAAIRATW